MTPFKVDTTGGQITVTSPSLSAARAFFVLGDARTFAEYLNAAWNDGWNTAFRERSTQ